MKIGVFGVIIVIAAGCDQPVLSVCGDGLREGAEECDGEVELTCLEVGQGFTGGTLGCSNCTLDTRSCTTCGNAVVEDGEVCDGLADATCVGLGQPFIGGQLACTDCDFDTSGCIPDVIAPAVTITSPTNAAIVADIPAVAFTITDALSFTAECAVDDGAFATCDSPFIPIVTDDGPHTVSVRARDVAMNASVPVSVAFTLDRAPPVLTPVGSPPPIVELPTNTATFTFGAIDLTAVSFTCTIDGVAEACTSPKTLTNVSVGSHLFVVTATDAAGNETELADPVVWEQRFSPNCGASSSTAATSCKAIRDFCAAPQADGQRFIRTTLGTTTQTFCDMTTAGGGWTLVFRAAQDDFGVTLPTYPSTIQPANLEDAPTAVLVAFRSSTNAVLGTSFYSFTPIPAIWRNASPFAVSRGNDEPVSVTLGNGDPSQNAIIYYGRDSQWATNFCSSPWEKNVPESVGAGRICLGGVPSVNQPNGTPLGIIYTFWDRSSPDNCGVATPSPPAESIDACDSEQRFTIAVR